MEYLQDTSHVTCFDEQWKLKSSRLVRSPIFISPDRKKRAFVEVIALVDDKEPWQCFNASRLYVKGSNDKNFKLAVDEIATKTLRGSSLQLIDWTPDSRFLVTQISQWQYFSDVEGGVILLYDAKIDSIRTLDQHLIFGRLRGEECVMMGEVTGVTEKGTIVFSIPSSLEKSLKESPFFMELPCVMEGTWSIDLITEEARQLPKSYHVQRYGKFEEHKPKN